MMTSIHHVTTLLLVIFSFILRIRATPIWRCPPFKLIPCKTLPRDCTSYRMIYIRHVHLECPACLICADSFIPKTFNVVESTTTNDAATKETRRQRRRRLKKRKDRRGKRKGRTPREKMPRDERERVKRRRKRRKERQRLQVEAANNNKEK